MSSHPRSRRTERGAVAVLLAVVGLILVVMAGASVDYGRAWYAKNQLQMAADAAVVAAAASALSERAGQTPDKLAIERTAQNFFNANNRLQPNFVTVYPPRPVFDAANNSITLTINAFIRPSFVFMFGISQIPIALTAVSRRPEPGPLDLVLALDTTESMRVKPANQTEITTKIDALKTAANKLVETLMTPATLNNVRIAIVPWSNYVNVTRRDPYPPWAKVPDDWTWVIPNWCEQWYTPTLPNCTPTRYDCMVDGFMRTNGCVTDCTDYANRRCLKTKRVERLYTWAGCMGTRTAIQTVTTTNSDGTRQSTTTNYGEVLDDPTIFPYPGFLDGTTCAAPIMDFSPDKPTVKRKILSLGVGNDTFMPSGLVWAWNVLTPGEPYDNAMPEADRLARGGRRVLVFMTDGKNTLTARPAADPTLSDGTLFANGSTGLPVDWRDGTKTLTLIKTLCSNIRAKRITVYTILFDMNDPDTRQLMKDCVGESNVPDSAPAMTRHFFYANNGTELNEVFDAIGRQLMRLRISK